MAVVKSKNARMNNELCGKRERRAKQFLVGYLCLSVLVMEDVLSRERSRHTDRLSFL